MQPAAGWCYTVKKCRPGGRTGKGESSYALSQSAGSPRRTLPPQRQKRRRSPRAAECGHLGLRPVQHVHDRRPADRAQPVGPRLRGTGRGFGRQLARGLRYDHSGPGRRPAIWPGIRRHLGSRGAAGPSGGGRPGRRQRHRRPAGAYRPVQPCAPLRRASVGRRRRGHHPRPRLYAGKI